MTPKINICLKLLFLTFIFSQISAYANVRYTWVLKDSENIESGICVETTSKAQSEDLFKKAQYDYSKKVPSKKCKIDDKLLSFIFMPRSGRCLIGDTKTGGTKYFSYVDIKKCKTENTGYKQLNINGKFGCYEIDLKSEGASYYRKAKSSECLDEDSNLVWVPSSEMGGTCYNISANGTKKLSVKKSFCRPEKPAYRFIRTGPFKGYCLERSTNPINKYSQSVKVKNCRPNKTDYYFYKEPNQITGKCYEVDSETKGDNYIKQVPAEECKD